MEHSRPRAMLPCVYWRHWSQASNVATGIFATTLWTSPSQTGSSARPAAALIAALSPVSGSGSR